MGLALAGCTAQAPSSQNDVLSDDTATSDPEVADAASAVTDLFADVTAVEIASQNVNGYTFAVTIESPDTGCDQYANWWEVVTQDGELVYRRILVHSHVDEQPFRRTGGPVNVQPDQVVIVRAHMDPHGYGTQAMQGSANDGFSEVMLPEEFASDLATADPQPTGCAY
ncbi:hypothetical protein PN498_11615 [Oscillatoria sp. CS-180]|uniref:hypothetical protein n=1 Tax=Oscillatoria sp. CS-180 TaxID=3021720 RepID=UPI00232D018D|nr:hypothetical protein [Oscillatoria sp. CS-180]MDB9526640.1 hypothetical protein [Oscillatoria sp. CS-180]